VDSIEGDGIMKEVMNADGGRFFPSSCCWNREKLVIYSVKGFGIYFENVRAVVNLKLFIIGMLMMHVRGIQALWK